MNILKNIKKERVPEYDLSKEIYSQFKHFRLPLILLQLIIMVGTFGYMIIDDFPLLDALYQTGITFTTVGFGEINHISQAGRLFTITLIIFGFAIFTLSIARLIEAIIKGKIFNLYKERAMLQKIAQLKNHFIIFYHNEYTKQLAREFRKNNIPFVVVDPREDLEEKAKKYNYKYFIQEEVHNETAFLKAHLSSAKGVISLSTNISDNITIIASIRLFEEDIKKEEPYLIICHAQSKDDIVRLKRLGADKVVAPPTLMAKRVCAMAVRPEMENVLEEFLYKKDTPLDLEEITIQENSWMLKHGLKDAHLRDKLNVSVVGISKQDGTFIEMPSGNTVVENGYKLLVIGNQRNIVKAKKLMNITEEEMAKQQNENTQIRSK